METMTLPTAIRKHLSLAGESSGELIAQIRQLTPEDKDWLKQRFEIEFGYKFAGSAAS